MVQKVGQSVHPTPIPADPLVVSLVRRVVAVVVVHRAAVHPHIDPNFPTDTSPGRPSPSRASPPSTVGRTVDRKSVV